VTRVVVGDGGQWLVDELLQEGGLVHRFS
jgi:hypothetical protein